jgi:PAS domain S-box-containing protein
MNQICTCGLFERLPVGLYRATPEGALLEVNTSLIRMLAYPDRESLLARNLGDLFADPGAYRNLLAMLEKSSPVFDYDVELRRFDGTTVPVVYSCCPVHGDDLREPYLEGSFKDISEWKHLENELRNNEARFRALVKKSDAMVVINTAGEFTYISPALENMLGYTPEVLMGRSAFSLVHPDDVGMAHNAVTTVIESGNQAMLEFYCRHADNSWRYLQAIGANYLHDPALQGLVINLHDITARKKIEEEIRIFKAAFETSLDGLLLTDTKGNITYANPSTLRIYGYNLEEITKMHTFSLAPDPGTGQAILEGLRKTGGWVGEITGVRKNGECFPCLLTDSRVRDIRGNHVATLGIVRDITEQKQAEKALRENEARYRTLVETCADAISLSDLEGRFLAFNKQFTRLYGYESPEEITMAGVNAYNMVVEADRPRTLQEIAKVLRDGSSHNIQYLAIRKNGEVFPVEVSASLIYDAEGQPSAFMAISRDITVRKLFEEELLLAKDAAEVANRAKSEFLANMSHELRTPLNAILGFNQVLERGTYGELNGKQMEFLKYIRESGNHLLEMVNDILDLAKIEAGKFQLEKRPVDLELLLRQTAAAIATMAEMKQIKLVKNFAPRLGYLETDEIRLKQVVYNLLSNAVKFTDSGKQIGIDALAEGQYAVISVWDEGIGIPGADLERIFNPFEQVRNIKGTGLGLAIVKRIVTLHGGTVGVISNPGSGSRFTVRLPGLNPASIVSEETEELKSGSTQTVSKIRETILVVEDNSLNQELIRSVLEAAHFRILVASSGEEALNLCSGANFDLVLMDIQLPGINGIETMEQMRARLTQHIPFIALTSYAMKGDREKYLGMGFDNYLSKPLDIDLLLRTIEAVFQ